MHIGIITLGCTKNQVDSELMQGLLKAENYELTAELSEADIIIVNTCGFIQAAKEESIQAILSASQYKENRCRGLIVAGCLSQRYAQDLMADIPEIDGLVGTGNFTTICDVLTKVLNGERVMHISEANYNYEEDIPRVNLHSYSTYVKIAEGCNNWCSYCAIPLVRGEYRSRSMESIMREVSDLASKGLKEINLIAQDTTRYGTDLYGEPKLSQLLEKIQAIPGILWIRLLYCYPDFFTDELIERMASLSKVCKYVDLPLQHINDRILETMNRRGNKASIKVLLAKLRVRIPEIVIRTTFIVGFPGETNEEFRELVQFVEETEFDHLGVFKYSREEDTLASILPGHISESIKELRHHELMTLQQQISRKRNEKYLGSSISVLVEGDWDDGPGVLGRAMKDAPEVDGRVYVTGTDVRPGRFISVRINAVSEYDLFGVMIGEFGQ